MDLSSSLSGSKEFRIVKRGYDPDEVDAFLDQIALGVAELKRKLSDASERAAEAPAEAGPSPEAEEIHRALIIAQRAADEEVRSAREEAEQIRTAARDEADEQARRTAAEVAAAREAGRAALESEIADLEGVRAALQHDVVVLERHVDEQREVVQAAVGELQALLDHPDAFRVTEAAGISAAAPTAPAAPSTPDADAPDATQAVPAAVLDDEPDADPVEDEPAPVVDDGPAPDGPVDAVSEPVETAPPSATPASGGAASDAPADAGDDDFLAELRKAMHDEEPLGPRDAAGGGAGTPFPDPGDRRSLFGRRR